MTEQPGAQGSHTVRGDSNISFQANGDIRMKNANIAGRDINITKVKQYVRNHPVVSLTAIATVLAASVYGGVQVATSDSGVDLSVVSEPGAAGAFHTSEQVRVAERIGDAAAWCTLVAPTDGGCEKSLSGAFAGRSQAYRDKVGHVSIGKATASATEAQVPLSWDGEKQGTIPLEWSGGRWQLSASDYGLVKLGGGVFLSLVDAQEGNLKLGGIPIPS
ncbi:hypothetical protein [Streptomyces sp. B1I3]|uniref:hypothetical protein n=1 Tax=Streptomyces sp. B1I3 TaxID=3042264 RepID=UPI002781B43D|nr:hypothetical protein [Streptomyces sp. B1I3]MDQ0795053.1 hypothetical protein [Streptomyces sp. B1I3]